MRRLQDMEFEAKSFFIGFFACALILGAAIMFLPQYGAPCANNFAGSEVEPLFSPNSEGAIMELIRSARQSIDVEMYVFTNEDIARELVLAAGRGVRVRVILEGRVNSYNLEEISSALSDGGVLVKWASPDFKLTHSKMMLVDGKRALVGSINFSKSAVGKNREAAAIIEGGTVKEYIDVFERDWEAATLIFEG